MCLTVGQLKWQFDVITENVASAAIVLYYGPTEPFLMYQSKDVSKPPPEHFANAVLSLSRDRCPF
jgi:hypothetical protein